MNLRKNFMVLEVNYDFTYLYNACNKIRKSVKDILPIFDEDDDPCDVVRYWDKDKKFILRISPTKAGLMINLKEDEDDYEIIIGKIKIFQQIYSSLVSILDIKEDIENFTIVTNYLCSDYEIVSNVKNRIGNIDKMKDIISANAISEQQVSFKYSNEYSQKDFLYQIENNDEIRFQLKTQLQKDFDIYNLIEEIKKNDEEVQKFINTK